MSACSYFSAVEDPSYMSRFYVVYFVFTALVALNRLAICVMYPLRELLYCFKLNKLNVFSPEFLQPIGPRIVLLPGWQGYKDDVVTPVEKISMMRRLKIKGCSEERAFVSAATPSSPEQTRTSTARQLPTVCLDQPPVLYL